MGCNHCNQDPVCDSALPETCEPLQTATSGARVIVEDQQACKRTLEAPAAPSVLLYDATGKAIWRTGAAAQPLNLPNLQTQSGAIPELVGQNANGDILGVTGTAAPAENELFKWTGTQFEPVEISKQFGVGTGALVRDVAAPSLAQWRKGTNGQVLQADANGNAVWGAIPGTFPIGLAGGRLTLASGSPVMTASVLTATVLYYAPFTSNQIALYNGTTWSNYSFTERSISLAGLAASTNFDVFLYDSAGVLTLELTAWTNDTTRSVALTTQDGVTVRSGATTRRYLGTIRTTSTIGQSEWSYGTIASNGGNSRLLVWNNDNRVPLASTIGNSTNQWIYGTATWRRQNGETTGALIEFVTGRQIGFVTAGSIQVMASSVDFRASTGIGYDSNTAFTGVSATAVAATGTDIIVSLYSHANIIPTAGYHTIAPIENASGNLRFFGDNGSPTTTQNGTWINAEM